jgi:hypothetical protein
LDVIDPMVSLNGPPGTDYPAVRKGTHHSAEAKQKIGASSAARVTPVMRARGRAMCHEFAEQKRVTFTPEMIAALRAGLCQKLPTLYLCAKIGVGRERLLQERRAIS